MGTPQVSLRAILRVFSRVTFRVFSRVSSRVCSGVSLCVFHELSRASSSIAPNKLHHGSAYMYSHGSVQGSAQVFFRAFPHGSFCKLSLTFFKGLFAFFSGFPNVSPLGFFVYIR